MKLLSTKSGKLESPMVHLALEYHFFKLFYLVQNYLSEAETNPQGPVTRHGSSQLIMARYGLSTVPTTILSPVIFNHRYFNLGMRYNNGIFIIDDPGYYRIDIKSYCHEGKTDSTYVGFYLMINSKGHLHQYSRWAAPSQASAIYFLNAFDTVFVKMIDGGGKLARGAEMNNIQIEKLD